MEFLFNEFAGLKACDFIRKNLTQMLSCEYCEIFKNTHFEKHLQTASSGKLCLFESGFQKTLVGIFYSICFFFLRIFIRIVRN